LPLHTIPHAHTPSPLLLGRVYSQGPGMCPSLFILAPSFTLCLPPVSVSMWPPPPLGICLLPHVIPYRRRAAPFKAPAVYPEEELLILGDLPSHPMRPLGEMTTSFFRRGTQGER
ncbi:hypothetical protein FKM82_014055, partial [Ascaphus truei]